MTTNFALSLSFEGIQLLHRVTGGWRVVGDADVEDPNLDAVLADLRKKALALEPGGLRTKIVIPLDQIKYLALDTTQTTQDHINAALDGATPYDLDELVIDCERRGGRTHIAAVARETLDEAEAFARAHKFNPVAFVAIPEPFTFQSEVFFGPTAMLPEVLGPDGTVECDILPIMVVGTRIKSRLLIFDIPEDELPPSDGADLAALLAPHVEEADAPAETPKPDVTEAVSDEAAPDQPEAEPEIEAASPEDGASEKALAEPVVEEKDVLVLSDAIDEPEVPEEDTAAPATETAPSVTEAHATTAESEDNAPDGPADVTADPVSGVAAADQDPAEADRADEAAVAETPAADNVDYAPADGETDTPEAEPDLFSSLTDVEAAEPVKDTAAPKEETPEDDAVAADTSTSETPVEDTPEVEEDVPEVAATETVTPPVAEPTKAKQPVLRDPTYPMPVDPIIAEYHTARPKYKRRARRRVVGSITAVAPAADAAALVPPPKTSKAPVAPARPVAAANNTPPKKLLVGTAIAASFAVAGLLAWWQLGADPVDAPAEMQGEPAAPVETIDSAALDVPVTTADNATPLSDEAPRVGTMDVMRQTVPSTDPANAADIAAWTGYDPAAPVTAPDIAEPDAPLAGLPPMPAPAEPTEAAQAEVGAPILRGRVLSPDEAARIYAATGVWQRAPRIVDVPDTTTAEGIIWPDVTIAPGKVAQPVTPDANALQPELTFVAPADPPPPDATFDLDENGNVLATAEGAVTPEGAVVFAGLPDLNVRTRPALTEDDLARMALLAPAAEDVVIVAGTPDVIPPLRPANAALPEVVEEDAEPAPTPGGVGLAGLQPDAEAAPLVETQEAALGSTTPIGPRPQPRPSGLVPPPPPADLPSNPDITSVIASIAEEAAAEPFIDMTPRAVSASRRPDTRPRNFATVVANARQQEANRQAAAAAAATPQQQPQQAAPQQTSAPVNIPRNTGPVPGGVARAATQEEAIGLREINLIGVYGRPNNRRALVRLPNGSFVRVEIGSSLDGGQVTAIGDNALNYVKRGRTYALQVPG